MVDLLPQLQAALADRYTIEGEVGRGGMGVVYRAWDLRHARPVALKVVRPELGSVLAAERFLREIQLAARLQHPHIVPLYDSGEVGGALYYVMPYVEGESLRVRLTRERQLPLEDALQITRDVADALGYAHSHDVLHRDIKPENILLSGGHALVVDFGIGRAITAAGGDRLTESGISVGTPAYMSPEQATGDTQLDGRSDLYSLACVLYEMLAGHPPFLGASAQEVIARQTLDPVPSLRTARSTVPPGIEAAIARALAKVPADRYATAAQFPEVLESGRVARADYKEVPSWGLGRRRSAVLVALASLALVVTVARIMTRRGTGPTVATSPTRVAVFPFSVPAGAKFADLGEGLMDLLSDALDGAGEVRRVDPNALMSRLQREGIAGPVDLETAQRVARELGAGGFVLGRVVDLRDRVHVSASLYSLSTGAEPARRSAHEGVLNGIRGLVDSVARDVLTALPAVQGEFSSSLGPGSTRNYAALRDYLRGQALMRRHRTDSACSSFHSAVRTDSSFALAWLRLAEAQEWGCGPADTGTVGRVVPWERASELSDQLSARDRALLGAGYADAHGEGLVAEKAALAMVNAYPDAVEGWRYLGDIRRDYAWQLGRSMTEAESAYQRALALDPDDQLVLNGLALVRYVQGRKPEGDSLWVRALGGRWLPPEDSAGRRQYLAAQESRSRAILINRVWSISAMTDSLVDAARFAALLADPRRRPENDPAVGHFLAAWVHLAGGQWRGADSEFLRAAAAKPSMGVLERAWFSAMPFFDLDSGRLRSLRDSLVDWEPPPTSGVMVRSYGDDWQLSNWLMPHAKDYALGLVSMRLGDVDAGAAYAKRLERAREPHDSLGLLRDLALEVRALGAAGRKDWERCLTILEATGLRDVWTSANLSPFHLRSFGRFLRAEALFHLGRYQEALGWYGTLWFYDEFVWIAPVQLREGEIHERLGHPTEAVRHYRRFLVRWRDADPQYQPLVHDVERRVARLSGS